MHHDTASRLSPLEPWRVSDSRFARAYAATGDQGRGVLKTMIAALFASGQGGCASTRTCATQPDGLSACRELTPRAWFALVLEPAIASAAQVVSALMPAITRRIPGVCVVRPASRAPWPRGVLTALELCGVEQVYSPPAASFRTCLEAIVGQAGEGAMAWLGRGGVPRVLSETLSRATNGRCPLHALRAPEAVALLEGPGIGWDQEALAVAHQGLDIRRFSDPTALAASGLEHVFAPAAQAPAHARLVLGPGAEALWDWPDMPDALFLSSRLVYTRDA